MGAVLKRLVPRYTLANSLRWYPERVGRASMMTEPIVTVKDGKLRGITLKSVLGPSYLAFKGIPFAAPPTGDLRFKDPQPPTPWTGIRDASKCVGDVCAQLDDYPPNQIIGGEDCLYLNVYTSSLNGKKPVMVWIHGGAFVTGTGNDLATKPDYLITKDVVLVSPNYRLGALGFLNLGHEVAPGNQGLKDLIVVLKWVKDNIGNFGGDPGNVTIFGISAGGALVHFLTISPAAKGLFHKAIAQSGTATCPWAESQSRPENGFKLAKILGKDSTDPREVVDFLRTIETRRLVEAQNQILTNREKQCSKLTFGVNVDAGFDNPVLPAASIDALLSNDADIPMMIGYTSHEYLMFIKDTKEATLKTFDGIIPFDVKNLTKTEDPAEVERLSKKIRDWYFDGNGIVQSKVPQFIQFKSDVYFVIPANRVAEDRVKRNAAATYLYKFSYVGGQKTATNILVPHPALVGASHADEVSYLFYVPRCKVEDPDPPAIGTKDRITIERLTSLWTDFAKTGNPTPSLSEYVNTTWKPVTKDEMCYLDIGQELKSETVQTDFLKS